MNTFSILIFVADGDPDGLRIIERSNLKYKPDYILWKIREKMA